MIDESKLEVAINLAHRAQSAYNGYLKDYLENCYHTLFVQFLESRDIDHMIEIQQTKAALDTLKDAVQADIDSGKYAEAQLRQQTSNVMDNIYNVSPNEIPLPDPE